jgi:simple sugar transport system ATP-binding protein
MNDSTSQTVSETVSPPPFLQLERVSKAFAGVQALNEVSLTVGAGEVHCLAGENGSGKSTLIKIMAGALEPDAGEIIIGGKRYVHLQPINAIREGIQIIYQDFSLFPNLTVAENIALNQQLAERRRLIDWRRVRAIARQALDKIGVDIALDARVESLPVADKQLIAISRALLHDAKLIVMDEPTTALTDKEVRTLLGIIRRLQTSGVAVLFVSHKLSEVLAVSEKVTVLRNGKRVAHGDAAAFDLDKLTFHMIGRRLEPKFRKRERQAKEGSMLRVEGLRKRGHFEDISFELFRGEILGLTGLLGSGRTALALALFGLVPTDGGALFIGGERVHMRSVGDAIRHGVGYVPEDRLTEGLFATQSIGNNIVVSKLGALTNRLGFLDRRALHTEMRAWVEKLRVRTPSPDLPVQSLSGGNQQRVVLARWLATQPKILILNGPTVGVDVGSKADIHEIIHALAEQGMGVLVISDDLQELLQTCSRLLIMKAGRITETVEHLAISEAELARKLTR